MKNLLSWSYTSSMTKSTFKSDLKIDRWIEFAKPSPVILWIAFTVVVIIAILITIDWLKSKLEK